MAYNPEWDTSCPDWERLLLAGESLVPSLPLFEEPRAKALRIFKRLRIPDVIGTPRLGDACGEWVFPIVEAMFGALDPATYVRHINEGFILVPKGNGKTSSVAAPIILVATIMNERPKAESLLIAPSIGIAHTSFEQILGMIALDDELRDIFHPQPHLRRLTHRGTGAKIEVKAADTEAVTGGKATYSLLDETHEFALKPKAAKILTEIRGALSKRKDGFFLQITTQSKEPPVGIFSSELKIARDIRDGKIKLPRLAVLYELPRRLSEREGWRDRKLWPVVNPNLNRSVSEQFLINELIAADALNADKRAEKLALLSSQHFNVELGSAQRSDSWAGADHWDEAHEHGLTFEEILRRCDVVVVGIDGGGLDDLLGLAVVGRCRETGRLLHWGHAWCHRKVLERRKSEASRLLDFESTGHLTIVDELGEDVREVGDIVERIWEEGLLPAKAGVGVDQAGIGDIPEEVVGRNIPRETIVGIPQGWKLNGAIKTAERKLASGDLVHCGSPLMAYAVMNAKVEPVGNAIRITKQASGTAKIDPLMALLNTMALFQMNPSAAGGRSVYEDDDVYV